MQGTWLVPPVVPAQPSGTWTTRRILVVTQWQICYCVGQLRYGHTVLISYWKLDMKICNYAMFSVRRPCSSLQGPCLVASSGSWLHFPSLKTLDNGDDDPGNWGLVTSMGDLDWLPIAQLLPGPALVIGVHIAGMISGWKLPLLLYFSN